MPIDPSIPLNARSAPVESPVDQYAKVLGVQQAINGSRLASLQIRSMETELGKQARIDTRLKALGPGAAIGDVAGAYLGEGDAKTGAALLQNDAAVKASQSTTAKNNEATIGERAKNAGLAMDEFGQAMIGVKDDAGHMAAIARLSQSPNPYTRQLVTDYSRQHQKFDAAALGEVIQGTAAARAELKARADAAGKTEPYSPKVAAQRLAEKQAGATQVSTYSSPVAGVDANGNPVFAQSDNRGGPPRILEGVKPPPKSNLTAKEVQVANSKILAAQNLLRQIAVVKEKFTEAQKDKFATGYLIGSNPTSEKGRQFDAAVNAMRSSVTAVTRVPGVGSMSDFETKLDQAKMPSRADYNSVTSQQIQEMEDLAKGIIQGYSTMLPGADAANTPAPSNNAPPPASLPPVNDKGFKLMRDANGNQAYVGPNGEVEEVR